MKRIAWIVIDVLISALVLTALTHVLENREAKSAEDPDVTTSITTTVAVPEHDQSIPECENPGSDVVTIPPMIEPEWPETPGAE